MLIPIIAIFILIIIRIMTIVIMIKVACFWPMRRNFKKNTTDQSRNGNHCNPLVENLDGRPFDSKKKMFSFEKRKSLVWQHSFCDFTLLKISILNKPIIYKCFILPRRNITIALAIVQYWFQVPGSQQSWRHKLRAACDAT